MPLSRRSFLNVVTPAAAPLAAAFERGREAEQAAASRSLPPIEIPPEVMRLDSNENPLGPGPRAMEALIEGFEFAGRYPTNARPNQADLREAVARKNGVGPENVMIGNGSAELLRIATRVYTSGSRHLITASPSFEAPEHMAERLDVPVRRIPVDQEGRLDVGKMAEAARWSGLVFFCNPNNPTGAVHSRETVTDFVARVRRESPDTAILIDEAYHDYVEDPAYGTALPLALELPHVFVTRTLSKAHGMAGLRVGYAIGQARTIEAMQRWVMAYGVGSLALAAAIASLSDQGHIDRERARNAEVRRYTTRFFQDLGLKTTDSQANFVFVEIGPRAEEFREACFGRGVAVGRAFPPLGKTWTRISLGTMDEMAKATQVFERLLSTDTSQAAGANRRRARGSAADTPLGK